MKATSLCRGFLLALAMAFAGVQGARPAGAETPNALSAKSATTESKAIFSPTPLIDIAGKHDFADASTLSDAAAAQLTGLCSLAEFKALPEVDRHVYAFDPWPAAGDDLGEKSYAFNFRLGSKGSTGQKIRFAPEGGGPGGVQNLARMKDGTRTVLKGFQNLDWSGNATHDFKFDKPVAAFGVVLRSSADFELRKFFWQAAVELNGHPISYTLSDGTIVQLGERDIRGALLKADTDAFIGVIDRSGKGIISVSYTIKGLAGNKAQSIAVCDLAFATLPKPAIASVINLRSSCDFESPESVAAAPATPAAGLSTLDEFRSIVGNKRFVYHFDTWPQAKPDLGSNTGEFSFDLKGKGEVGQKVTITATNSANTAKLTQASLTNAESVPYHVLGGLGYIDNGAWAEQTFKLEKPVWAFGVTYRSPGSANLAETVALAKEVPVSYTLSDGTVVNVGDAGGSAGSIAANGKTFVGVMDTSGKGISAVTFRVQGATSGSQPLYIEDIAFAMAGPPPGDWKLTFADEFDGKQLNPNNWSTGYKFVEVINSELEGYVPENVVVGNGLCTIKTEYRDCLNTDRFGKTGQSQKFASGAFTSVDKFTQTYGYFEARIKMPHARGAGVWPAFWLLPDRGRDYPDGARYDYMSDKYGRGMEIDIFEFMPRWKTLDDLFPVHVGCIWSYGPETPKDPAPHGYGGFALDNDGWGPKELDLPKLDSEFHTYGLYWSPQRLIWFIDSKPIFRVKDPKHVPDVPHYFLFNTSVHGNGWGKSPDKSDPKMEDIIADMPNQMEIDYFRAYSGTLEEPLPTPAGDVPGAVTKYSPPAKQTSAPPAAPSASPTTQPKDVPAAPVNSKISSPSTG